MFESRCGASCGGCTRRGSVNCGGCINMDRPFWGGECEVKLCCETKRYGHCGECGGFPCETVEKMGTEQGFDPKPRLANLIRWAKEGTHESKKC